MRCGICGASISLSRERKNLEHEQEKGIAINIDNETWDRVKDAVVTMSKVLIVGLQSNTEDKDNKIMQILSRMQKEEICIMRIVSKTCKAAE